MLIWEKLNNCNYYHIPELVVMQKTSDWQRSLKQFQQVALNVYHTNQRMLPVNQTSLQNCFNLTGSLVTKFQMLTKREEVVWSNNILSKFIFFFWIPFFQIFLLFYVLSNKTSFKKIEFWKNVNRSNELNYIYKLKNVCLIVLSKIYLFVCSKNNLLTFLT
jgi:hypothetical protein